ncbi:MAG: VOC family protein [Planctomycetota bacterium]|jgi:predicted enzyme related to lactoylglutathione lyase
MNRTLSTLLVASIAAHVGIALAVHSSSAIALNQEEDSGMPEYTDRHMNYVEFRVESADALSTTRDFFSEAFGWSFQMWGETYTDSHDAGTSIGVTLGESGAKPPMPGIYVDDIDSAFERVSNAGATITKPIFEFPGGRRFQFREPSGNEIAVFTTTGEE